MTDTREAPRLLLVDDNVELRRALADYLTEEGFSIVGEADDGLEAIEQALDSRPEVVLMDLRMPNLTGIDAAREILSGKNDTEVVLLTAYDDPSFNAAASDAGVFAYLTKGVTGDVLCNTLLQAAKHSRVTS